MLLAHGTTELNANNIESNGYFNAGTYFLKLSPDKKLGIFGVVGFSLRNHPKTEGFIDLYCSQDLIIRPFKKVLKSEASKYIDEKKEDNSPGLIYVIDASKDVLDYHGGLRSFLIPNELFSTERIPTSTINHVICLDEYSKHFSKKYGHPVETLDEMSNDPLLVRIYYTLNSRFQRLVMKRK